MTTRCALTTVDNPYNPLNIEEFALWWLFDVEKGYNSSAYLGRIAKTSDQFTDQENNDEIERAIDEIIKYDFMDIYRKVKEEVPESTIDVELDDETSDENVEN